MKALACALAISTMTACVVGEDQDLPTGEDLPPNRSEAYLLNGARTAFNFFVQKGFTKVQAAGIVGNLQQESSVRPTAVEYGGGPGRGIAQWSIGGRWNHGSNSITSFASRRGTDRWQLQTQLEFVWYELSVVGGYGLSEIKAATTLQQAVSAFASKYEICGTCRIGTRLTYAQQALSQFGGADPGDTGGEDVPPPPPPPAVTSCYSGTLEQDVPENTCVESVFDGYWYQCSQGQWIDRWSDPDPCISEYPL